MSAGLQGPPVRIRGYEHEHDYERVNEFLIDLHQPGDVLVSWLQPRWEYMHFHWFIDNIDLGAIGVAEVGGEIVGLIHPEHSAAFVYLQLRPGHYDAAARLFDHAEAHFGGMSQTFDRQVLGIYLSNFDETMGGMLRERGFEYQPERDEVQSRVIVSEPIEVPSVPEGFTLTSLEDDNDLAKMNRVLWRGFNHEGSPDPDGVAWRERAQRAPNFDRSLTIVAVAPNAEYVSFAGMWVVPQNRVGYVEPVATDPDYRRMGLGSAAVLESMRRAADKGAETIWVGSDQEFYQSLGFETTCRNMLWMKDL